jgi:glyoxylase-like metal-dependent hydrolase (beta-lactamase superfamily II)
LTGEVEAEGLHARAAEAGIHRIALPTPFAVGRVNCWLIEDEPLTLVDVGPNSGGALDVLERGLARFGHRIEDLELIVLSHQHLDHTGLAGLLAERSGADVAALGALSTWLGDHPKAVEEDDVFATEIMREHGIPDDVRLALRGVSASVRGWGGSVQVTRPLEEGSVLRLRDRELHVHHRPGHSPSDIVLHDRSAGVLIAADHLIRHISSNPLISRPLGAPPDAERPHALEIYLASMQRTQAMEDVSVVLTGHGDPIADPVGLIDERFRGHDRRKGKILGLIREQPRTAHEIAGEIWGDVAVTQAYLTLSEVIGHVDLLVAEGLVEPRRERDVTVWHAL